MFQACVRFHTCCMLTCTVNEGCDTLPREYKSEGSRRGGSAAPLLPPQPILPPLPPAPTQPPTRILGMRASDIDKYSRVIFPIMFLTFHLMYWMIYISIAGEIPEDVVYLQ